MGNETKIAEWNERWAIPGVAQVVAGNGGLAKVEIASAQASAEIYLHGAQVTSWKPKGFAEVIFLSVHSRWEEARAIRGGIPVCFPWFRAKSDNPQAPAHGFVRTKSWDLSSMAETAEGVVVSLTTESDDTTRRWWPYEFRVEHRITAGTVLKQELIVTNSGSMDFSLEEALHTYYRVGDAEQVRIAGLDGVRYLDNRDGNREKTQSGDVVLTGATDNAYLNTQHGLILIDPVLQRRIAIEKENSSTTVVWNPWDADARAMADLGDEEWREMACVEASNILSAAVTLAPGAQHTMSATIRVAAG